ncbi:BnaC05g08830D [Brassica napus]|uniref:BnaC05g08830D protein n=1 Tax=Brassica napus TaxID=3708 RepID=A0A078G1L3_BRANA|nr:BnaC05g08830D [Brassica napus]
MASKTDDELSSSKDDGLSSSISKDASLQITPSVASPPVALTPDVLSPTQDLRTQASESLEASESLLPLGAENCAGTLAGPPEKNNMKVVLQNHSSMEVVLNTVLELLSDLLPWITWSLLRQLSSSMEEILKSLLCPMELLEQILRWHHQQLKRILNKQPKRLKLYCSSLRHILKPGNMLRLYLYCIFVTLVAQFLLFRNLHISFPWLRNNGILHFRMELKGPFPKKMLRKVSLKFNIGDFFSLDLSFNVIEGDSVLLEKVTNHSKNEGKDFDLLDKISIIDLEKRLSVSHALAHAFISGK